jgi:hypothetical protein
MGNGPPRSSGQGQLNVFNKPMVIEKWLWAISSGAISSMVPFLWPKGTKYCHRTQLSNTTPSTLYQKGPHEVARMPLPSHLKILIFFPTMLRTWQILVILIQIQFRHNNFLKPKH